MLLSSFKYPSSPKEKKEKRKGKPLAPHDLKNRVVC
jgi:hypothetical protein